MKKRPVSFALSPAALAVLESLATENQLSRSEALERLLLEFRDDSPKARALLALERSAEQQQLDRERAEFEAERDGIRKALAQFGTTPAALAVAHIRQTRKNKGKNA